MTEVERSMPKETYKDKEARGQAVRLRLLNEYFTFGDVNQIAVYLGVTRDTIYDWIEIKSERYKEEFSYTYKWWQTKRNALLFRVAPYICSNTPALGIFLLKAQGGYLEIDRHELTGKDGARLPAPQNIINFNKFDNVTIAKELEDAEANGVDPKKIQEVRELAAKLFEKKKQNESK